MQTTDPQDLGHFIIKQDYGYNLTLSEYWVCGHHHSNSLMVSGCNLHWFDTTVLGIYESVQSLIKLVLFAVVVLLGFLNPIHKVWCLDLQFHLEALIFWIYDIVLFSLWIKSSIVLYFTDHASSLLPALTKQKLQQKQVTKKFSERK